MNALATRAMGRVIVATLLLSPLPSRIDGQAPLPLIDQAISFRAAAGAAPASMRLQTGMITGRITDAVSGDPVREVDVSIEGATLGAVSGQDGTYLLSEVPAGTHTLIFARPGYANHRRPGVSVPAADSARADVVLERQAMPLRELVESGRVAGVRILRGISTDNDSVVLIERAGLSPSSPLVIGQRFVAGLQLAEVDPSLGPYFKVDSGVLVTAITYPSPGASAGIVPGDVVVAVAGRPVATIDEVRIAFAALPPEAATTGEGIPISVVRQGETVVLRVPR